MKKDDREQEGAVRVPHFDRALYNKVLRSARWRDMKARLLRFRGERCEGCPKVFASGAGKKNLSLHHRTYDRLGHELDEDVQLLCENCHEKADRERERQGKERSEAAQYDRRLQGWVEAMRGPGAEIEEGDAEAFEQWLEVRGEDW